MKRRLDIRLVLWIIALLSGETVAIQYTPIEIDDLTDCALILTNSRQYTANLLQSDFGGPVNCITYDAINQAYSDARKRIDIPAIEDDWRPEEVAAVGQVMLDVSQQIAKEFDLNREDIEVGLPRVDVTKTAIKEICPAYLSTISCRAGKYRRHDGLCNNIQHPAWGAAMTTFSRLLPPQFSDDISSPRISQSGKSLPPARVVSRTIHVDEGYHDHAGTVMLIAWGQFMDHDFTLMGTPLDSRNRNEPEECCYRPEHLKNPYCMEIDIPEDDYFYRKFNVRCQDFVRAFPGVQSNCRLGSRTPFNTLTAVIDGNTVYGVTEQFSRQLRAGHGGLLRMNPAFAQFDLKELLPMKTDIPDEGCVRTNHSQFCFLAGEIRVNEQLVLTCIHTLMAREHNRIAKELAELNPHWNDEILYQEARRITIAEIQHVSFNEFLPLILGKDMMEKFGLLLTPKGYWNGYNAETNPAILDAFSAAAFRFGHSLLPSAIERWSKAHKFIASKRLSELIRRPYDLYRAGVIDEYFTGLLNQVAQAMDDSVTQEVTNNLLKKPGNRFGLDLVSFNIQRGRDFGLPGYMYFRKHCGLQTADSFNEMFGSMPNSTIYRYMTIYESPWDIDLWSGGAAEKPLPGSMVGPTFACIIASQMSRIRQGDRFWYELPNQPSSFTAEQLQEIKKVKLSRILCDNTDLIDSVQIYAMVLPDHDINPRVPCRSSVLPRLDLSHWRDIATKSFIDNGEIHTSFEAPNAPVNRTASPSAYEYHIKTVAIIEGSSPSINVNDILNAAEQDARDEHRVSKRSVNAAGNTTGRSDDADVVSSHRHDNVTASNSTSTLSKDLTKRSYHAGGAIGYHRKAGSQAEMTQAIMEENPSPKIDASYRRSASASDDEGDHDIEDFFRKNVPIYDGVPIARRGFHRAPFASQKHHFLPQDEEEEEEEAPLNELLEVHPGLDAEHEFVPMKVDEFGKQKVMENEAEDEEEDQPSYPYPSKYHQSSYSDEDAGFYHKPAAHPYPFENTHSSFKSHNHDHSSFSDNRSPPRFGTSHQFNSFADQQPRYYKHFRPSIPYPAYEETEDPPPYSPPAYSYPTPARPVEYPRTPYTSGGHDFVPKRAPLLRGSYASKYPARTTHVPQTLEEYHRIHGTFDTYQNPAPTQRPYRPIIVPQDDKEDDEEEKDADPSQGPKSFVSLNFGTGVGSDDEGVSIRHQIGHIKPKSAYFGNSYEDREIPVEYPPETVPEGSAKYEESPGTIRSFVDSVFKHNDYDADIVVGKKSNLVSPYNPHFGERVKSKGPAQNILWHRKASDTRVARDKQSRDKNDRLIHEENIKLYDNLVKEVTMKPAKRDVNDRSNESEEAPAEDEPETASQEAQPDEDEESPQETEPARKQADAEDEPKLTYWSHSTSEPN